ncbi:hypothetical protein Nmel_013787 [Mimus melanotis]
MAHPYPLWSCARRSELERTLSSRAACARWKQAVPKQTRYTAEEPTSCSQSVPPGRCWHSATEKGTWQAQWLMRQGCWCVHPAPPSAHGTQHIQTFNTSHHSQNLPQYPGTPSTSGKSCISGTPGTPGPLAPPALLALPAALLLSQHPMIHRIPVLLMPLAIQAYPVLPCIPLGALRCLVPLRPPAPLGPSTLPVSWVSQFPPSPSL